MMTSTRQRGAGKLGTIIWLVILGSLIYVGFKVVPAYIDNYQLEDLMKQEARFANINRRTPEQLRDIVFKKVRELDIPARREDVRVEAVQSGYRISVKYTVVIDLPGYQLTLNFSPTADPRSL
jgi:hypothetical protein